MNICFVTSGSENIGTYFRAFFWAKYLVRHGHSVTLISSHQTAGWTLRSEKFRDGVRVITYLKSPFRFDYPGYLIRPFLVLIHLLRNRYNVIHSFVCWQPPSLVALVTGRFLRCARRNIKVYADWDDLWGTPEGIGHEHGIIISRIITGMEKFIPRLADRVTVCSRYLFDYARESGIPASKITVIVNGSNTDGIRPMDRNACRIALGYGSDDKIVLFIGQFYTEVFPKVIGAVNFAAGKLRKLKLVVAGSIPPHYRSRSGLTNGVVTVGSIDYDKIPQYLSAADLLLLPMDSTVVEKARFPIRFGDYLASGTPILASPQGEIRDIIHDHLIAYTADIGNEIRFGDSIVRILNDEKRSALGKKAREWAVKHFSWQIITRQLEAMYES